MTRSAEVSGELLRIAADHGGLLRAADVVREAADAASPLHSYFEWDDTEAAQLYRLQQARQLIRVVVQVQQYDEQTYRVRTFVSLTEDRVQEGGGYRVMTSVLSSPNERARLLNQAMRELNNFKVKYQELTELIGIFRAIDRASRTIDPDVPQAPPLPTPPAGGMQPTAP